MKTKLLIAAALAIVLLTSVMSISAYATTVPTFTLSAQLSEIRYVVPQGTVFNGSISTTGTVRFWVNDPDEAQIVNLGLIDNSANFSFVAQQTGNYTFNFENDMPNSVQVTFSYETNPDISGGNTSSTPPYFLIVPIIIAVVGSILIIFVMRRRNKKVSSKASGALIVHP